MADFGKNTARAVLGQGLGMGWGDEAEAWLRSKLGQGTYEENVAKIRSEYGDYAKNYPFTSGASEFVGGAAPGIAMMMVPGGQALGVNQLSRTSAIAAAKLGGLGALAGGVSGAGTATEGQRGTGAASGAALGGAMGAAAAPVVRGASAGATWLRERLAPTEGFIANRAAGKLNTALAQTGATPQQIEKMMRQDTSMRVPSVVANTSPGTAKLAETVAQRSGAGSLRIEKALTDQKLGAKERTHQQVAAALKPGNFYDDEQRLVSELRAGAKTVYDDAYAHGAVDDPRIMQVLQDPEFAGFFEKAKAIANKEAMAAKLSGQDPAKYMLPEIYKLGKDRAGNTIVESVQTPDVRTLDYIKRGIDATIDDAYKGKGMSTAEASALRDLRKVFVNAIDENVPAYQFARQAYAGDMEVIDALRKGMNDFNKLDHEQVVNLVKGMGPAEKEAFRTGVSRDLYGKIMGPSGNMNAAQRIIGSPEMQAKLQPLFDNPAQFNLFKSALERESQLFNQSNRILGGSQTGQRIEMQKQFEEGQGIGSAVADAISGGFWNSLTNLASRATRNASMSEQTADKLSEMLMSKSPKDVAAVVKLLEEQAAGAGPKAFAAGATERGLTTGAASAVWPSPQGTEAPQESIDDAASAPVDSGSMGIEDYLKTLK
jgi:hypothetical protein